MMGALLIFHAIVCALLIGAILLQTGRGASTGAAFGGGAGTFFGPSGEVGFLGKAIVVLFVIFVITTVLFFFLSTRTIPR